MGWRFRWALSCPFFYRVRGPCLAEREGACESKGREGGGQQLPPSKQLQRGILRERSSAVLTPPMPLRTTPPRGSQCKGGPRPRVPPLLLLPIKPFLSCPPRIEDPPQLLHPACQCRALRRQMIFDPSPDFRFSRLFRSWTMRAAFRGTMGAFRLAGTWQRVGKAASRPAGRFLVTGAALTSVAGAAVGGVGYCATPGQQAGGNVGSCTEPYTGAEFPARVRAKSGEERVRVGASVRCMMGPSRTLPAAPW